MSEGSNTPAVQPTAPRVADGGGLTPGTMLGRYQIVGELAMGGMAELYVARHATEEGYEKVVAIKRVLPNLSRDEAFVQMFLNEARLAAGLDHPNIVHVIDFGADGREHFLAMEYVHGKGVHEIQRAAAKVGGVPLACALTIVRGVAEALHYAHERKSGDGRALGLVHRDVSPSNVLISYDGAIKLADFGIATATALTRATRTGSIKGKLSYMAPEQVRGEDVDRRADVFSLGVVLYELTTGSRCFYAPGEFALINRVVEGRFERPTQVRQDFDPKLEAVILRALKVDRNERFESTRALQVAIEDLATKQGLSLSSVGVSELMGQLFGHQDYPKTDVIPLSLAGVPRAQGEPTIETTDSRRRRRRKTAPALLIVGTLGVAVGLGGGVAVSLDDSEPVAGTAPSQPVPVRSDDAPVMAAPIGPTQPVAEPSIDPNAAPTIEPVAEPGPADLETTPTDAEIARPTASATKRNRRSKAKSRGGKRGRTKDGAQSSKAQPADQGYLPPSRRQ